MEDPAGRSDYATGGEWRSRSGHVSWEELAFAEDDAAGSLWPPRSYTCSFCRKVFRSAQALGGHMNVHRRDRARLKQAGASEDQSKRAASSYTLVFSHNHNKSERSRVINLACSSSSTSLTSRVSGSPRKEGTTTQENSFFPPSFSSHFVLEHSTKVKKLLPTPNSGCRAKRDLVNTDLSESLNMVNWVYEKGEPDESCKRRRRHESSSQPSISNPSLPCKNDIATRCNDESKKRSNRLEELDLELRLGVYQPKVN